MDLLLKHFENHKVKDHYYTSYVLYQLFALNSHALIHNHMASVTPTSNPVLPFHAINRYRIWIFHSYQSCISLSDIHSSGTAPSPSPFPLSGLHLRRALELVLKKLGETLARRFLRALLQNRAQSRLLYLFYGEESIIFPTYSP